MLYFMLIATFFTSFVFTLLLIKYKDKIGLFAYTNHRTLHKKITPTSGGIAIFLSFLLWTFMSNIDIGFSLLFSLIFVFMIGIYDDYFGMSSKQKILFLFIVVNILFFNDFYISYLGTFLGKEIYIDSVFAYIFLTFAIIGFVNAVNLIDGIDGLSSIVGIIILSSFLYIGIKYNNQFLIYIPAIYIMSIIGYLCFNWSPAKIFMGDNGSLTLGFIIAIVAIYTVNLHYITPVSTIMLAGVPILDTFLVMSRRIISGKNPFVADRLHMHHIILKQQRNNTRRTVLLLGLLQMIFSYIGLGFKSRDDILILVLFFMLYILFYFILLPKQK